MARLANMVTSRVAVLVMLIICALSMLAACSPVGETDFAEDGQRRSPSSLATSQTEPLRFGELYTSSSGRGLRFSDKLTSLAGNSIEMTGFMAPPLKPALDFFVLTAQPMSICPFCDSDASWPADIVVVYINDGRSINAVASTVPVIVTGVLEVGSFTDVNTGFVSQVRIRAERVEPVR